MYKILFFCLTLSFPVLFYGQQDLTITALNRFAIVYNDTTHVFYARPPEKKDRVRQEHIYYWFNGEKILSTEQGFSGRILDGTYTVYYPNKNLRQRGSFKRGLKSGSWKSWDMDGKLTSTEKWRKGERVKKKVFFKKRKRKQSKPKGNRAKKQTQSAIQTTH